MRIVKEKLKGLFELSVVKLKFALIFNDLFQFFPFDWITKLS